MGQNSSANCCGTTADCQQTEVEVSEYQLHQNQLLKRPAQVPSQQGVFLSEQQQQKLEEQQKLLLQSQQQLQQCHFSSTQQFHGGEIGSANKKNIQKNKNMHHHELANHLRKISNNDRIIMENSVIHSTTKRLNEVASAKKVKKELAEIVHFAKVLQLKIISSSTLQKGSVLYVNAQGLENSLRKELDGVTFFGCKKRCRNIDNFNLQQGQLDNFSSYSSSSSNEDDLEDDDTFDQADSNQILDHIYDDKDYSNVNPSNKQQQQQKSNSFPFSQQKKNELNSKSNLKLKLITQQKQPNQINDDEDDYQREEEKENNPYSMNTKQTQRSSAPLSKQNQKSNKTVDGVKKTNTQLKRDEENGIKIGLKSSDVQLKKTNKQRDVLRDNNKNDQLKDQNGRKNGQDQNERKSRVQKWNKNGDIVNDFVIPSPDPEISKRHRGKHFQISYHHASNSYRIKDLGIGFGCFYKLEGPLLLKDNHLLNIGLIFVVINFTLNEDNTVLDASTSNNKSSNTTQLQHPSNNSQIKNQSMLQSQNISNNNNLNNLNQNNHNNPNPNNKMSQLTNLGVQQNQFASLNQSVDFANESINKICIRLKFFGGPCNGESCLLDPQKETFATLGRNKEQCSLYFDDHLLSKIQSRIVFKPNEGWYLIDGSQKRPSTNGTWLYLAEEQEIYEGMIFKANQTLFQCSLQ